MRVPFVLFLAFTLVPGASAVFNDWPQAGYDQTHQGNVPPGINSELVEFQGTWWNNLSIAGPVSSPTVREDIVYFGDATGKIWAIDRESGGTIWSNTTGSARVSGTAVGQDFVYAVNEQGSLYSFNRKNGQLENGYPLAVGATFAPPMLHEDLIYIGSSDGSVKSYFLSTRQLRWSFSTAQSNLFPVNQTANTGGMDCPAGSVDGTPVLFEDWIMFGSTNKCFFAVKRSAFGAVTPPTTSGATSDLVWAFKAKDSIRTTPTVDRTNRRVIFGDLSGNIYAVSVSSSRQAVAAWTYTEPFIEGKSSEFKASPVISGDKVIVAARNGIVRALSLTAGTVAWSRDVAGEVIGSPAVANGRILVGSFDRKMYMLNASTGSVQQSYISLAEPTTWVAVSGTQAFWADRLGNLYSFGGKKPDRSDLVVEALSASLIAGQSGGISFKVKNQGVLDAPNTTAIIRVGGIKVTEMNVPALDVGKDYGSAFAYAPSGAGPIKITFFADATRQLKESDEANNEKTIDVEVAQPPEVVEQPTGSSGAGPAPSAAWMVLAVAALVGFLARRRGQGSS